MEIENLKKIKQLPKRIIVLVVLLCLFLPSFLLQIYTLNHTDHDQAGIGGSCSVCANIGNFLQQFGLAVCRVLFVFLGLFPAIVMLLIVSIPFNKPTLVNLKSRMNS